MDNITKEKLNILAGASTIESFIRIKAVEAVDYISNIHPMLKLYFDSDMNSEIEDNTLLIMSEALIWSVEKFTEKGIMSNFRSIGVAIAQTLSKRMYFAKLVHHANTGRITSEQFYDLAAEYVAAESVNLIHQLWDFVGAELPKYVHFGIQKLLEFFSVDPQTAEWITGLLDGISNIVYSYVKRFLTQEKIQKFIKYTIEIVVESARALCHLVDKAVEIAKDSWRKTKRWGRNVLDFLGLKVPDFLKEEEKDSVSVREDLVDEEVVREDLIDEEVVREDLVDEEVVREDLVDENEINIVNGSTISKGDKLNVNIENEEIEINK